MRWTGIGICLVALVAPGARGEDRDVRAVAAQVDARLEQCWSNAKIVPVARSDDGEFFRRASLDLVGRIPTASQTRDFLDDPDPAKRSALVDRLLESPAYAERAALLWRRLLLPETDGAAQVAASGLEAWISRKVKEGASYDRVVRELLTARLGATADDMTADATSASPAAFFAAKGGKPEVLASDTARAFLGLRLECAQCHNHPFAKWKREEFWGFAAFFAGVPQQPDPNAVVVNPAPRRSRDDGSRRELTIPGTSTVIQAAHLDRSAPAWRPRAETRQVLAEWITDPANPYFARAAVNRTWARLFGVGLIDPVDDLDAEADPALAAILDDLARAFRDHGHDLKFLLRTIMATRAYQLSSATEPGETAPPPFFARMPVRGMSPAQFIDSLGQATGSDIAEIRPRFAQLFADRDEAPTESQTTILQALTMMNGSFMAGATDPATGDVLGAIAGAPYLDTAGRVEALYLATLTRRPTADESAAVVRHVDARADEAGRTRALADVFWALLNGPEFRLIH